MTDFGNWFSGLRVLVLDAAAACDRWHGWLIDAGAAVTRLRAISAVEAGRYDLILIDADDRPDWEDVASSCRATSWTVIVAEAVDDRLLRRVLRAGAGCVSKAAPQADFLLGVHRLITSAIPDLVRLAACGARVWSLSPHLAQVLGYNLWGYSNRDIADAMSISLNTAEQYQDELRRKTGVKTKHSYLRRLLALAGQEPLLPATDYTQQWLLRTGVPLLPVRIDRDR